MGRGVPFGCGQCLPCRYNRRRQWTWRQYFEALMHEDNCFVTLTYADSELPRGSSLEPRDLQLWLKRLRKFFPQRLRYFAVGEYSDAGRPHYHLSVFGLSQDEMVASASRRSVWDPRKITHPTWPKGIAFVAEFNEVTAQYVCGYVTKKMTAKDDPRLLGRHPEFARMSNRPGLGTDAMKIIADGWLAGDQPGAPPMQLKMGNRTIPLSRFLLSKLRIASGLTPDEITALKSEATYEKSLEMSALLARAVADSPLAAINAKDIYLQEVKQKILQIEGRHKLYKKRETL